MIKNILVPIAGIASDASALETAFLVGRLFDACLTCLHVRPDPAQLATMATAEDFGAGMVGAELFEALKEQDEARTKAAKATFEAFCSSHDIAAPKKGSPAHRISCEWSELSGDIVGETVREGRFHDLIVLARAGELGEPSPGALGSVLIGCGRPLIIAPKLRPENLAPTVAIAWKETAEAARAVTAAMPLLAKADRVYVLAADEGEAAGLDSAERLARQLQRHGCSAEAHRVTPGKHPVQEAILAAAGKVGADLMVMGGYGHSRVREFVFGGFTRYVLSECRIPVFLSH